MISSTCKCDRLTQVGRERRDAWWKAHSRVLRRTAPASSSPRVLSPRTLPLPPLAPSPILTVLLRAPSRRRPPCPDQETKNPDETSLQTHPSGSRRGKAPSMEGRNSTLASPLRPPTTPGVKPLAVASISAYLRCHLPDTRFTASCQSGCLIRRQSRRRLLRLQASR